MSNCLPRARPTQLEYQGVFRRFHVHPPLFHAQPGSPSCWPISVRVSTPGLPSCRLQRAASVEAHPCLGPFVSPQSLAPAQQAPSLVWCLSSLNFFFALAPRLATKLQPHLRRRPLFLHCPWPRIVNSIAPTSFLALHDSLPPSLLTAASRPRPCLPFLRRRVADTPPAASKNEIRRNASQPALDLSPPSPASAGRFLPCNCVSTGRYFPIAVYTRFPTSRDRSCRVDNLWACWRTNLTRPPIALPPIPRRVPRYYRSVACHTSHFLYRLVY